MKITCNVKIEYKDIKEADKILKSIEVDNLDYIRSERKGKFINTDIESNSISSIIHTLDDYLACVSIAEKIIKKKWKQFKYYNNLFLIKLIVYCGIMENNEKNIKKKYEISRHHAWAGSILLAILLAIRIFFETSDINEYNQIILIIGFIIIVYMLISLILTYRYRSSLTFDDKTINVMLSSNNLEERGKNQKHVKNLTKIEKKKAKEKLKKLKKSK